MPRKQSISIIHIAFSRNSYPDSLVLLAMAEKERWKEGDQETGNGHSQAPRLSSPGLDVDNDEMEEQLEDVGIIKPPDGGYGWVVVFASFLVNIIVDGVIFSISESIVPLWEKEFQTTTSMVTVAPSLLAGFYLLSGPLASALSNNFGCKKVAIAGAIIATSGLMLTVLVPALPVLYFTFGIIGGLGYGLIFLPAVVIVGQYFSERRALATGIAVCGSGIGTSLFSWLDPIILGLVNNNWRIFLVIIAAVTLLCVIFASFFKPLQPSEKQIEEVTKIATKYMERCEDNGEADGDNPVEKISSPNIVGGVAIERFKQSNRNFNSYKGVQLNADRPFLSTIELHTVRQGDRSRQSSKDLAATVSKASMADLNRPLSKMDIFFAGSTTSLAKRQLSFSKERGRKDSELHRRKVSLAGPENKSTMYLSLAGLPTNDNHGHSPKWSRGITASLRSLLDISLLQSPSFLILALGGFLTLACFFVPFMFIGALAKQKGVDESLTKYLVVIIGLVNLSARVLCGLIADHPKVDPLVISNVAVILGGLATAFAPFLTTFWMFAVYCVPFAFGVACFAALRSIICVELLGIEKLTNAYGMLMLFMGVAALAGPPFAALLKNLTSSFTLSFHVMGCIMMLSGIVSLPLRAVSKYESKKAGTALELESLELLNKEKEGV